MARILIIDDDDQVRARTFGKPFNLRSFVNAVNEATRHRPAA